WDEFYVETLGWVPVDPALGDEKTLLPYTPTQDFDARSFYFGNLDNQHLTFTKGLVDVNQMNPSGTTRQDRDLPYSLSLYAESVGGLASYSTSFDELTVNGTY
ncbi:MAG TPA: transcription factor, partial [Spirochaetia bacterium]|nr:transcription factor [Spirochaetia bacterium]